MSEWSHGYNVSLGYTYGYYRETAPDWLDFCARLAGYMPPSREGNGAFRYLELGCGQGYGLCLSAAMNPEGEFLGIDFNPEHIAHANGLAIAAGLTNVRFAEADFMDLAEEWPADYGQFHYVILHGILSWVPIPVRHAIVKILETAVPAGGVVYNSYNTQPGWVSTQPFQHMARRLQAVGAHTGPRAIDESINMFEALQANNSAMMQALPTLKNRVESVKKQNRNYLVQEYLHDHWHLFWFSEMAEEFATAKLGYIATATLAEMLLPGVLPEGTRNLITGHEDPTFRQEVQDCVINQSFRRDIFCRGPRRGFQPGFELVTPARVHLLAVPNDDVLKVATSFGELQVKREVFGPIVETLQKGSVTMREILELPPLVHHGVLGIAHAVMLLIQGGILTVTRAKPAQPKPAHRVNAAIAAAASGGAPYNYLASPVLGTAIATNDIDLMLLDTLLTAPGNDSARLQAGVVTRLQRLNRNLIHDGQTLSGDALNERIAIIAKTFVESTIPRWRSLGCIA